MKNGTKKMIKKKTAVKSTAYHFRQYTSFFFIAVYASVETESMIIFV
jgi:hypothetical protein